MDAIFAAGTLCDLHHFVGSFLHLPFSYHVPRHFISCTHPFCSIVIFPSQLMSSPSAVRCRRSSSTSAPPLPLSTTARPFPFSQACHDAVVSGTPLFLVPVLSKSFAPSHPRTNPQDGSVRHLAGRGIQLLLAEHCVRHVRSHSKTFGDEGMTTVEASDEEKLPSMAGVDVCCHTSLIPNAHAR